ncbi:MAG TPA: hypothetical protein PK147_10625 [Saprospiraceae bacterium]|nr:hypothetical protein [Saprospiraceae bacterium]MCB9329250.1 phosphopeptide-binding protein [Lewinellaceae bacterium]HPK10044.1 hypothetical protein [Saprospiraceae bacterium]HPQ22298.1 hypothetical protein [Saprospiraceae bacterium]
MKVQILAMTLVIFLISCKSKDDQTRQTTQQEVQMEEPTQKYKLTPMDNSPSYPDAELASFTYKNNTFDFNIKGDSYKLGVQTSDAPEKRCANSAKGQHIHVILNNEPYLAEYENKFEHPLENGNYYMVSFLSRSYHESIKSPKASIGEFFTVDNGNLTSEKPIDKPMVIYSRPKGLYVGKAETERVMLDFYLVNTEISPSGNKILANINGETHFITEWQPYIIEGLPMGENTITLTLINEKGLKMETPYNPVSRTFTLKEDISDEK